MSQITKEDFDSKAKGLLGESNVHLHNEFLFAILVKCQTGTALQETCTYNPHTHTDVYRVLFIVSYHLNEVINIIIISSTCFSIFLTDVPVTQSVSPANSPSPIQPPATKKPKILEPKILVATKLPRGALDPLQYYSPPSVMIFKDLDSILLCSHELVLPDVTTMHARMLLGAWEAGLEDVPEDCAVILLCALKVCRIVVTNWSYKLQKLNFLRSSPDFLISFCHF